MTLSSELHGPGQLSNFLSGIGEGLPLEGEWCSGPGMCLFQNRSETAYLYQDPYWVSSSSSEGWALVFSISALPLFLPTSCIFCLYRRRTRLSHRQGSFPLFSKTLQGPFL